MQRPTILVLKALIAVMILLILACQLFLVPPTAQGMSRVYPEFADLVVPGIVIAELFLLCIQVVNVCVWRLLSMVGEQNIFSTDAFRWVDVILGAIIAATLLIVVAFATLFAAGVANPSVQLLCALGVVVGSGLSFLVIVMRGLLKNAAQLQQDLSEVV
ncbi:DUF2975 domain-containing protein [Agromyces sp. SYSU K20354]|uniref:DUF2975 domain-containing protein n=1 Tax=Agromyces cavernae TaxID=2898659 RepID=UPI001E63E0E6|nr:DUF2975 domain-containing protein [Agromyces cavernae]MCD2442720.1 DUF2975 domain-containing protein [Agromyces cavernae]